ncbi:prepilin-type N-terminal cleavage/methylation domain-containing protein [Acidobacteria bacterium AH-259-L09]|nr:prepilin-type N-terminal cleavage/methylation domain-containing protein [Acidobacteria bacterium AH-259-L09]
MKSDRTNRSQQKWRGFSLVELLIVLATLSVVLAIVGQILLRVQADYLSQRQLMEAQNNARVAMDIIIRLVRSAGYDPQDIIAQPIVDADPDSNSQWDSIHLRADWNPPDGALDDPFEDIIFSTQSGSLFTEEPGDPAGGIEFLEGIQSLTFSYYDDNKNAIPDPITNSDSIAYVELQVQIDPPDSSPQTFSSSATVRTRE